MNDQIYTCQCKGCPNGQRSTFTAAPSSWFEEKHMSAPKNCPICRSWIKSQVAENSRCRSCGQTIYITANQKISHYKLIGAWTPPTRCRPCSQNKATPSIGQRVHQSPEIKAAACTLGRREMEFGDLAEGIMVQSRHISVMPEDYAKKVNGRETRQQHIECHIDGVSKHRANGHKSPSALSSGKGGFAGFLGRVNNILNCANQEITREYLQENSRSTRIIRLTLLPNGKIERTVIEAVPGPNGHELVTTFDNINVATEIKNHGNNPTARA